LRGETMRRKSRVQDIADQAVERVAPVFDEAKERLAPYVEEARTHASDTWIPAAHSAAHTAADTARSTYHDRVEPQVGAALTVSEPYRQEAKRRGTAALAAAKGEIEAPAKKTHKLRNLMLLLGLGGIAFAVVRYFKDDSALSWQSDYPAAVPDPSDPGAGATAEGDTDDAAAAAPDEALADADEHPHRPTDPDSPLERKDL
ncbi:MAG: DUF5324 family protein, partial [Thermocrispum sp.]